MPEAPVSLDFAWTEEQSQVLDLARRYAADLRAACRETESQGPSERLRRVYDDLALSRLHWPQERGGLGLGLRLKLAVLEILGHADAPATLALDRQAWVGTALLPWASDVSSRASFHIVNAQGGTRPPSAAWSESMRPHTPAVGPLSRAFARGARDMGLREGPERILHIDGNLGLRFAEGRVRGAIPYLPAADTDQLWLLRDHTLLRLDLVQGGFASEPVDLGALHALGAARVTIDAQPAWLRELTPAEAHALAAAWRLPLAAVLTGLARAAYEYAKDYALQRVAFGRKVAHHQAVAFLFADLAVAVETSALRLQEAGASGEVQSADLGFLQAAESALFVSNQALQLVGGAGYMRDHLVEKFMREARALSLLAGGVDAALEDAQGGTRPPSEPRSEFAVPHTSAVARLAPGSALYPYALPEKVQETLVQTRILGRQYLRPLGLEADRQGRAHPPDHPFYAMLAQMGYMERRLKQETGEGDETPSAEPPRERWQARAAIAALEEASYWDRGMAVSLPGPGLGGPPILNLGTSEQRQRCFAPFRQRGRPAWGAFGMTEAGAGSDVARIATRCVKRGGRWVLNGEKTFCSNSPRADWIVVYATVDPALGRAGHRAFVVPRDTPGLGPFHIEKKMGLLAYETASFPLQDVEVGEENLLGGEGAYGGRQGFVSAMKTFDLSRPAIAAMAVGIGRAAQDHALAFAREAFDLARPLPRNQRVRDRLVTIDRRLGSARLLCWKAACLLDRHENNTLLASMAKAYAAEAALAACSLALEILGEAGVTREAFVEKLFRDAKAMDLVEGTGQIQRLVIARRTLDYPRDLET